jgi:hypothetical protein
MRVARLREALSFLVFLCGTVVKSIEKRLKRIHG